MFIVIGQEKIKMKKELLRPNLQEKRQLYEVQTTLEYY
jgi:hypothetical protein